MKKNYTISCDVEAWEDVSRICDNMSGLINSFLQAQRGVSDLNGENYQILLKEMQLHQQSHEKYIELSAKKAMMEEEMRKIELRKIEDEKKKQILNQTCSLCGKYVKGVDDLKAFKYKDIEFERICSSCWKSNSPKDWALLYERRKVKVDESLQ